MVPPMSFVVWILALVACPEGGGPGHVDTGSGGLVLSHLEVADTPGNPLACRLSWTTNLPADSAVEYGSPTHGRFRRSEPGEHTEHEVLVIGLRAGQAYSLEAHSTTADGAVWSTPVTCTARDLPDHVAVPEIEVHDPNLARDGWTLFDNYRYEVGAPCTAVMVDMEGYPVWVHAMTSGDDIGAMDTRLSDAGTVLLGASVPTGQKPREVDLAGEVLWEGPEQPGFSSTGFMHHTMELLADDTMLTLEKHFVDGTRGDRIVVRDRDGAETWSWDTFDHLEVQWVEDWTHANSVAIDGDDVYLSLRNLSEIVKFSRATQEVEWRFGPEAPITLDGDAFEQQHAIEVLAEDHLLVFDNGPDRRWSRAVEFVVDADASEARILWQYPPAADLDFYAGYWGDANRLDNGNTLMAVGAARFNRMVEVTSSGEVAWQAQWPESGDLIVGFYRAQRLDPPGIEVLE